MDSPETGLKTVTTHFEGVEATARLERNGWELDLGFPPREFNVNTAEVLLGNLTTKISQQGGGSAHWRVPKFQPEHTKVAQACGYGGTRTLVCLGRPLPLLWRQEPLPGGPIFPDEETLDPPLATRPFVPGYDEEGWLETNNAAFSWHPEQSNWTLAELKAAMSQPWFDPNGFLLHPPGEPGDRVDGFCWTKLDLHDTPVRGEIFVIATHPRASGQGLGKRLVLAGLNYLYRAGAQEAYLYTEADNRAAVALYDSLGFIVELRVRVYQRQIENATIA